MRAFSIGLLSLLLITGFSLGYFFPSASTQITITHNPSQAFAGQSELPDFSTYTDIKQKKSDFFMFLLPKVNSANEKIKKERGFIYEVEDNIQRLSQVDKIELQHLAHKYKVKGELSEELVAELLKRVNTIPASLVLAQAANESAWGTSRFAKQGNNLFGQWCYVKGCGIIPKKRGKNENHEVAKFSSVSHSIASYMLNLNSQYSYEDLRTLRAKESNISGLQLAQGLLKYSTRREAYVHEIQLMIRQNSLKQYD